ncbi:concanavalin A-like lectin/glucanase domain-containing protein [Cokeromyces recurvatus]|uniref:concanavalin A-like lectin/glucanase domain-containing protein n=1 Tax=Cokeromyces recurvatus TaxID=90255 RepID=UPI00221F9140|nr:concanavalin A-like lectin/glucanase domain-containing protein [Cokeromyces recurvatus]KAI7903420.1 concanavalin A-like lectin/glucanase domain-containing protein [Cokeromyces recurvatus]
MIILSKSILALFVLINLIQCEAVDKNVNVDNTSSLDEAVIVSSVIYAPVPTDQLSLSSVQPESAEFIAASSEEQKPKCHNYRTDFGKNVRGWEVENNLPYNQIGGRGPTLNATTYMLYGKVSATLRAASTGGSVTAFILIADIGDEIDFEFIGGDNKHVQTNYFWGKTIEYTVNGGIHAVEGGDVDKSFHKYTIDWRPDRITWLVDDIIIRTKTKAETCDGTGICKFPSHPARIQIGLWDGSIETGTAEWSNGPIDWSKPHSISAQLRDVQVECDPAFNQIVT